MIGLMTRNNISGERTVSLISPSRCLARGACAPVRSHINRNVAGATAIAERCPDLAEIQTPPIVPALLASENGLILVTGATGCGKSTTLAAMVGHLNQHADKHILTLEDPIEYRYTSKRCLIQQREIGQHCATFAAGLRGVA